MQWTDDSMAGFTTAEESWLPINPNYKQINTRKENKDPHSLLSLYKKLLRLRKSHKAFQFGSQQILTLNNDQILAFLRIFHDSMILVLLNYSHQKQSIKTPFSKGKILVDTKLEKIDKSVLLTTISLSANEGLVIELT